MGKGSPVNNITPPIVNRCAASRNLLVPSMTLSVLLTCARCAARWACRSRRTRCSGVSPGIRLAALLAAEGEAEDADLEVACGMFEVKRVASLTLRGPTLEAMTTVGPN